MSSSPPEKKIKLYDKSSDDKDRIIAELLAKNEQITREKDRITRERDHEKAEKDRITQEKDRKIASLNQEIVDASLFATFYDRNPSSSSRITSITCIGTMSSNIYPRNHAAAIAQSKHFKVHYLKEALVRELKDYEFEFEKTTSCYLSLFKNRVPTFYNEYDVHLYMNVMLADVATVMNQMIATICEKFDLKERIFLQTKAESSLFSNVIDHVVVYDHLSGTPILSVETKKFIDPSIGEDGAFNKVLGQGLNQLEAMKLMGHPNPFGAITCHNSTFLTWLNSPTHDRIIEEQNSEGFHLDRLLKIIRPLPPRNKENDTLSQSPLKMVIDADDYQSTVHTVSPDTNATMADHNEDEIVDRTVTTSDVTFHQDKNIDLFVNVIFCSLDGFYQPRSIIAFVIDKPIVFQDAIGLTTNGRSRGNIKTTYKGPLTWQQRKKSGNETLYLVSFIGRGTTSNVFRAITKSGYDCVLKICVQYRQADNTIMKDEAFQEFSEALITKEMKNFSNIYSGPSLDGYVWQEILNNLHCVVMPFFEPVKTVQRTNPAVMNAIGEQLQRFVKAKKKYRKCDQLWRHVGYFRRKIYLFDLGDLIDLDEESDGIDEDNSLVDQGMVVGENDVPTFVAQHLANLKGRAGNPTNEA